MADEYDFLFKSIVVGDGGVGKTALTLRFSKGFFTEDYKMTIGVDFHVKTITINTDEGPLRCKLQIWDTGGQERFSSIRPMYYRGSLGALLIFDVTSYESFEHLPQWIEEVRANVKNEIPLLLVGNKSDLIDQRQVNIEEINDFTRKFNLYYMETSAKTGEGVGDCFYILACLMVGSGVPDKLIAENTVFAPGRIIPGEGGVIAPVPQAEKVEEEVSFESTISPIEEPESSYEFAAPPVPEPTPIKEVEPKIEFEPEPEVEFAAPPVPEPTPIKEVEPKIEFEPEPEVEFAAPPIPEPAPIKEVEPKIEFEPEPEVEFAAPPVPEPAPIKEIEPATEEASESLIDLEFKTPDEILTEEIKKEEELPIFTPVPKSVETSTYTPKAVPFTSSIPVPAPPPEGFSASEQESLTDSTSKAAPFILSKRVEKPKPKPASMAFKTPAEPTSTSTESSILFPTPGMTASDVVEVKSDSLVDYMPETILENLSKKERKKLEKQKKKEAKERAKAERERKIQEAKEKFRLEQELKKKELKKKEKKEKKEKPKKEKKEKKEEVELIQAKESVSVSPSLFQALSSKADDKSQKSSAFMPFIPKSSSETSEISKLRIIPNVANIDSTSSSSNDLTAIPSAPTTKTKAKSNKKEIIICKQCGAMLSSDYAFCNKCGAKL